MAQHDPRALAREVESLLGSGRLTEAEKTARKAVRHFPKAAFFANLHGVTLTQCGRVDEAVTAFRKATALDPRFDEALPNLIRAMISSGRLEEARARLETALERDPRNLNLRLLSALCHLQAGQLLRCREEAETALAIDPRAAQAYNLIGIARANAGDDHPALAAFETAGHLAPPTPETLANLSLPLARLGRAEEALDALSRALELAPAPPLALFRYAIQLKEAGRREDAIAAFRRLLAVDGTHAGAWRELSLLLPPDELATQCPRLEALYEARPGAHRDRVHLGFALARAHRAAGDSAAQERWLDRANGTDARLRPYDAARAESTVATILDRFRDGAPAPLVPASNAPRPIFILGMIRSGTTLTERILAAHPQVHACGELNSAGRLLAPMLGRPFGPAEGGAFADAYRAALPRLPAGTLAFTDKMPLNTRFVGHLLAAFPEARIIHLRRDPRDVAWSIWENYFDAGALTWTNAMAGIAHESNLYARLMQAWRRGDSGRILDLDYAALTADVEGQSRRIADFCGLDWRPAMAHPEQAEGAVRTNSSEQIREPVHSRAVGRWKAHGDALRPFTEALDPALWGDLEAC